MLLSLFLDFTLQPVLTLLFSSCQFSSLIRINLTFCCLALSVLLTASNHFNEPYSAPFANLNLSL